MRRDCNSSSQRAGRWAPLAFVASLLPLVCVATKHTFSTNQDARFLIGPIGVPYGFLEGGVYNLTCFDFELTLGNKRYGKRNKHTRNRGSRNDTAEEEEKLAGVEAGFLLKRYDSESQFAQHYERIMDDPSSCAYEPFRSDGGGKADGGGDGRADGVRAAEEGIFLSMKDRDESWKPRRPSIAHTFAADEEGLYFLYYQICPRGGESNNSRAVAEIRSTFELDLAYHNVDGLGNVSYLTAGEMPLPHMFLYFSVSYALCLGLWIATVRRSSGAGTGGGGGGRPVVLPIHHMMTALLALKFFTVFFESVRYHYIRVSGHADAWSAVYYTFAFLKGMFLFTVILLIGSGWSFVKPFLNDREKKVIYVVLVLQVIDNVAVAVLTHGTEGEQLYDDWSAILHLVDILCCCAVLVPIIWSVNALEKNMESENDGKGQGGEATDRPATAEAQKTLTKLKLFRSFYLLVVAYIYFTRIVVFLFATILGYRHTWLRYFVTELGTLAFYAVVGMQFRPMAENPYFAVKKDDWDHDGDEAAAVGTDGVEMGTVDGETI